MRIILIGVLWCFIVATLSPAALAQTSVACAPAPTPLRSLAIPRFYANAEGSVVDPKLAKLHATAVAPLIAFLREIVDAADAGVRSKDQGRAPCAVAWLQTWAAGEAWLGDMVTQQAEYQRKFDLAGIALAYVKLKPHATPAQRAVIEPWLQRWAATARSFFDSPARKRNNHWYWLGLSIMAASIATDDPALWSQAEGIYMDAMRDIRTDGSLLMELERRELALFYHVFATMPLVIMAEIASRRGLDWYVLGDGALHRLVKLSATGLASPASFEVLAGRVQAQPVNARAGWLLPYQTRFPDRLRGLVLPDVPTKHRWLGGDVGLLFRTLEARN
jgi:poly(beta-D-mannuronate) lyase